MVRKTIAVLLFLYAGWQVFTSIGTMQTRGAGQGFGQFFWAIVATAAGAYLWKRGKKVS